jgi:hypothetical protein
LAWSYFRPWRGAKPEHLAVDPVQKHEGGEAPVPFQCEISPAPSAKDIENNLRTRSATRIRVTTSRAREAFIRIDYAKVNIDMGYRFLHGWVG